MVWIWRSTVSVRRGVGPAVHPPLLFGVVVAGVAPETAGVEQLLNRLRLAFLRFVVGGKGRAVLGEKFLVRNASGFFQGFVQRRHLHFSGGEQPLLVFGFGEIPDGHVANVVRIDERNHHKVRVGGLGLDVVGHALGQVVALVVRDVGEAQRLGCQRGGQVLLAAVQHPVARFFQAGRQVVLLHFGRQVGQPHGPDVFVHAVAVFVLEVPRQPPRHQADTRRGTHRVGRVGAGEADAVPGNIVHAGRFQPRISRRRHHAAALLVGEDVDDVGPSGRGSVTGDASKSGEYRKYPYQKAGCVFFH